MSVKEMLIKKHPSAQVAHQECIADGEPQQSHPIIFDSINSDLIRSCAIRTTGAAGPSGLNAHNCRRLCTSYKGPSNDLCYALATVAKRICSSYVDPTAIAPLLASRFIAIDKNPGVRPIGIGNTARRIIAKGLLKGYIQEAGGCQQLCGGQVSGIEAAMQATRAA